MPELAIPLINQQASGQEELAGASPVAINVCIDATGTLIRRPGISAYAATQSLGSASGLYVTNGNRVFTVIGTVVEREIWDISDPLVPFKLTQPDGTAMGLNGTGRPVFAETEMIVAVAGGADIQKIVLGPPETTARLGGSPPQATHIIANQSRYLANDLAPTSSRTIIRYSDIAQGTITYAGLEVWTLGIGNAGFFTAEADPDPIVALGANSNEVWAFGARSLQVFGSDPTLVFGPIAARDLGMGAAYSAIPYDQNFYWLDNKRRFVQSDGRGYEVLSDPIKRTLDAMSRVDDCFGYRVFMGPVDALVWTFPTDGRTFAFQKGGGWAEWLGRDSNNWTQFAVASYAYRPANGTHLVGLTNQTGILSLDTTTDRNGATIKAYVATGFLDRGTDARKHCKVVRLTLRRGQSQATPGPLAFFWWEDYPGQAMEHIPIDLGSSGDFEATLEFRGLGVYRRRQWFLEFAGAETFTLVSARETFDVLEA